MATFLGILAAAVGGGHLLAWFTGIMSQRGFSTITMKTNTAFCLLVAGAALVLVASPIVRKGRRRMAKACAGTVLLVGSLTLSENLFGWDLGIDQLLATEPPGALGVVTPNRMGTPACVAFILAGTSLLLFASASKERTGAGSRRIVRAQALALGVCLIALLSTLGLLYGARQLFAVERLTAIAWPTALTLLAIGVGLLFVRTSEGVMAQVLASDPGGASVRRLLIPAVLLPLALGGLRLEGEHRGLFDSAMGTALVMLTFIIVFTWLVYRAGRQTSQSSAALAESERQFRVMGETVPYGVWLCAPDGGMRYSSQSFLELIDMTQEEQQQFGWTKSLVPGDVEPMMKKWLNCCATGMPWDHEHRVIDRHGEIHIILSRGLPLRDEEGKITCWVGVNLDITERKKGEEELRRAKEDLEERVRQRTAELATRARQLRALAGELAVTEQRERRRMAKVLHDHLQQLLVAAKYRVAILGRTGDDLLQQATREVAELLDESIAASRSLTTELSPPILHEAGLNDGLEWLARRMDEKHGLFVELTLEAASPPLAEDVKILLFESVRELLFNAVKHSRTRSANVSSRFVDGHLQLLVADRGVGFEPKAIPLAGEAGGGFGLFSIRERLELIGGRLEIDSSPGKGSRFLLTAPLASAAVVRFEPELIVPTSDTGAVPETSPPSPSVKIRVVLADDHAVVRQGLAQLLGNEPDIEVVGAAADGKEAVELAGRLLPDVLLMDMSMPKLDGVEATQAVHADYPEIRIIGLSMFEEAECNEALRKAGAVAYVTKTAPAEDLVAAIRRVCQTNLQRQTAPAQGEVA
jgi:PAS domain S-box-containing protein